MSQPVNAAAGQVRGKYWMFTINNPTTIMASPLTWDCVYVVYQEEKGTEGTPHWQGYVVMKALRSLTQMKALAPTAHWERRKGTHAQAKAYVTKEDTRQAGPFEAGEEPVSQQGKRNDLLSLKRALDEGQDEKTIATDEELFGVWTRNIKAIERYKRFRSENRRDWVTETVVYWGPPGTGKSYRAAQEAGPDAYWLAKPLGGGALWFDGYDGQEVVVIDEFFGWIQRDVMCRLCDRYPYMVQTKGGSTPFVAKKIIITSNARPDEWWPRCGLGPMARRLEPPLGGVVHMEHMWEPLVLEIERNAIEAAVEASNPVAQPPVELAPQYQLPISLVANESDIEESETSESSAFDSDRLLDAETLSEGFVEMANLQ